MIKVRVERTVIVARKWKHDYICKCCTDEFYNILDRGSIRKTGFCCYCRDRRLQNKRCDCNDKTG